jgi:hypothetical protein
VPSPSANCTATSRLISHFAARKLCTTYSRGHSAIRKKRGRKRNGRKWCPASGCISATECRRFIQFDGFAALSIAREAAPDVPNTAVVRIREREELLREACWLAHRLGGYPLAVIATFDPSTHAARVIASDGSLQGPALRLLQTVAADRAGASVKVTCTVNRSQKLRLRNCCETNTQGERCNSRFSQ